MTTKIHAIYERGVFRPTDPVTLSDGTAVEITVADHKQLGVPQSVVVALEEISKLPLEGPDDSFSGKDHDEILYPKRGQV